MEEWAPYFMKIADLVKTRSGCARRQVGAVFVRDKRILATGFNQAPSGVRHCDQGGCTMHEGHCIRTIHAELNGIFNATRAGQSLENSTVFVTSVPCLRCLMALRNSGVKAIWHKEPYAVEEYAKGLYGELSKHFKIYPIE